MRGMSSTSDDLSQDTVRNVVTHQKPARMPANDSCSTLHNATRISRLSTPAKTTHEDSPARRPSLDYVPPGLHCESVTRGDSVNLYICATSFISVGHVWGPYGAHLHPEQYKRLLNAERSTLDLPIAIKSPGCSVDDNAIVLGEEHTWIQILYKTGLDCDEQSTNVDLVLDALSKTLTVLVNKEIRRNERLHGALRLHPGRVNISTVKSSVGSSVGLPRTPIVDPTSPNNLTGPRRDKKCSYCGIPFSSLDTLAAHMSHYCSKRPTVPGATSGQIENGNKKEMATIAHRTSIGKRNKTGNSINNFVPVVPPKSTLPSAMPIFRGKMEDQTAANIAFNFPLSLLHNALASAITNASVAENEASLELPGQRDLTGSLEQCVPNINLNTINSDTGNTFTQTTATRVCDSQTPSPLRVDRKRDSGNDDDSNKFDGVNESTRQRTACPGQSMTPLITPLFCSSCQRSFASHYLYSCHLEMSARILNDMSDYLTNSTKRQANSQSNSTEDFTYADYLRLFEVVGKLGLVLAAPLVTSAGFHYLPVHPFCGLLHNCSKEQRDNMCGQSMMATPFTTSGRGTASRMSGCHDGLSILDLSRQSNQELQSSNADATNDNLLNCRNATEINRVKARESDSRLPEDPRLKTTNQDLLGFVTHLLLSNRTDALPPNNHNTDDSCPSMLTNDLAGPMRLPSAHRLSSGQATSGNTLKGPASMETELFKFINAHIENMKLTNTEQINSHSTTNPENGEHFSIGSAHFTQSLLSNTNHGDILGLLTNTLNTVTRSANQISSIDPPNIANHSQKSYQLPPRPYLCRYCQTRFQAYTTFQAHQQYYCQALRDKVCNSTEDTSVSGNHPHATPSPVPTKRRRTTPISPASGSEQNAAVKHTIPPTLAISSNVSSTSGSGDDMEQAHSNARCDNHDQEITGNWELCGNSELRCTACGYVGQTPRGMKMHQRLHECRGASTRSKTDKVTRLDVAGNLVQNTETSEITSNVDKSTLSLERDIKNEPQ